MKFGHVDTLGRYVSEFDPEPDSGKKGIGTYSSATSMGFLVAQCSLKLINIHNTTYCSSQRLVTSVVRCLKLERR